MLAVQIRKRAKMGRKLRYGLVYCEMQIEIVFCPEMLLQMLCAQKGLIENGNEVDTSV